MGARVIGIGELLWDLLPGGRQPGGAPFNFAWHARLLGSDAAVISRVGRDALGVELLDVARSAGFDEGLIQRDAEHPTGTVRVTLRGGQPSYTIAERVAWDFMEAAVPARAAVREADAVCFGTLAQRGEVSARAVRELLGEARKATVIFDANLRGDFFSRECIESSLGLSDVVKVNAEELGVLGGMLCPGAGASGEIADRLLERYDLRLVVETLGAGGCAAYAPDEMAIVPGVEVEVVDCVGSGDAFTAALADGLAAGGDLGAIAERANLAGALVATREGATPTYTEEDIRKLAARLGREF